MLRALAADQLDVVNLLIDAGADLNVTSYTEGNALITCVQKQNIELMASLIEKNASVNVKSPWGGTALNSAVSAGNMKMYRLLLKGNAELDVKDKQGATPLIKALQIGNSRMIQSLIEGKADVNIVDNNGMSPLDLCVKNDKMMEINWLIANDADVNRQHTHGRTALMYALHLQKPAICNTLIDANADPNIPDDNGNTPVILCAQQEEEELLDRLIDIGADLNHKNVEDCGAIHYACLEEFEDIVEILLDGDADRDLASTQFGTPTDIVRKRVKNKAIDLLLNAETLDSSESIENVDSDREEPEEEVEDEAPWDTQRTMDWMCEEVPGLTAHRATLETIGVDRQFLIESAEEDFIGMGLIDDELRAATMRAINKLKHINVEQLDDDEIPEHVENLFRTIDLDGTGYIDEAEFSTALTFLELMLDPKDVGKVYSNIDTNNNGRISAVEFSTFLQQGPYDDTSVENVRQAILTRLAVIKEKNNVDTDMQRGMSDLMKQGGITMPAGMKMPANMDLSHMNMTIDNMNMANMELPAGFGDMEKTYRRISQLETRKQKASMKNTDELDLAALREQRQEESSDDDDSSD